MNPMDVVETVARVLEYIGVLVISITFVHAVIRAIPYIGRMTSAVYAGLKVYMGKSLMLGLEFLVAADIIRTVTIKQTVADLEALGLLILMRIVLGWSIAVETEGCWPWRVAGRTKSNVD
jgi:uncharacterized membrane protein